MTDKDDGADAVVIQMRPLPDTFPRAQRVRYKTRECRHNSIEIDERERIVTCKVCKQTVDPILALLILCRDWETIAMEARAAEAEAARLNEIIDERKKNRAKVSRARESRAECIEVTPDDVRRLTDAGDAAVGRMVLSRLSSGDRGDYGASMLLIEVKPTKTKKHE